jgi:hypothetical protein
MRARKRRAKPSPVKRPARQKAVIAKKSDRVDAADVMSSAPDDFGPWFAGQSGRLPSDFELDI